MAWKVCCLSRPLFRAQKAEQSGRRWPRDKNSRYDIGGGSSCNPEQDWWTRLLQGENTKSGKASHGGHDQRLIFPVSLLSSLPSVQILLVFFC
jgi:hypothetical protein